MSAIQLGDIEFSGIVLKVEDIAAAIQCYYDKGAQAKVISVDDLTIVSSSNTLPFAFTTVKEAIEHGTRLFDAICYFSLPATRRPAITAADDDDLPPSRAHDDIARAVFFQIFMVLVRSEPIASDVPVSSVPKFMSSVMGLTKSPAYYNSLLASFDLRMLDWRFIVNLKLSTACTQVINRMGLGVAGYRYISPFKIYKVRDNASPDAKRAAAILARVASHPADWSIHPVTRSSAVNAFYGSINGNCQNLILEAFSPADISEMIANKVLPKAPIANKRNNDWKNWLIENMPELKDPIFEI